VYLVVFEDAVCNRLHPITTGRLAFAITCGSYRLVDWLDSFELPVVGMHRSYLNNLRELDFQSILSLDHHSISAQDRPRIMLNARLVPSVASIKILHEILARPSAGPVVVWDREHLAAIIDPPWTTETIRSAGHQGLDSLLQTAEQWPRLDITLPTFAVPHEVISRNMEILSGNLDYRTKMDGWTQLQDGVFVAEKVDIGNYVVFDTTNGPIVLDSGVKIGPYTLLRGPIYAGKKCRILEHAAIKDFVSLGNTTKIGGEVEASVVEAFTNKQHHGFLGHSYLGSWVNLGAGTCNSDLKNTYGTVNMEYGFGKAVTGMQFLGCIMGDYCKSAINTGIFTGKVIGVCSMMYGFVTSNVPSFVNYARLFGQMATLPPEVMVATQQRMFARRQFQQRPCDIALIHDMYRLTQDERERFGDALSL
jgi:UDP-N-acetylglucosamine diphosphorylase / glucose-1-phosphate thymidylyltransferase / UDP-N-acetylgalactosamine diphosphorylase / glucosamine-1-phosphate N-acetyltransferase / galactosamine-1-phosphate N-acetyltransferase